MKNMVEVCDVFLAKIEKLNDLAKRNTGDTVIVGFALVRTSGNPYIWSIAVDKGYQNLGIGGNLLREIVKKYTLQKELAITLHVHEDNSAQCLYFSYGFRVQDVVKDYYAPKNGLLMRRVLSQDAKYLRRTNEETNADVALVADNALGVGGSILCANAGTPALEC
jgi:ribosomal protein S18 acetylase RimI-like enzyme